MKCYLLYKSEKDLVNHVTITVDKRKWTIYIIKTRNIQKWIEELQKNVSKYFVQGKSIEGYLDGNVYKSLFNNFPLPWVEFIIQNELEILQLSQDLSLIAEECKILPDVNNVFRIFHLLKPKQIRVIIVGQDPYPQPNTADGIAFSTFPRNPVPASLKNIFSELKNYENIETDEKNPDLTRWVKQGCFLINAAWTVIEGKIGSHGNLWKRFIENLLRYILEVNADKKIVICFFGSEAKTKYKSVVKGYKNAEIMEVAHPSPNSSDKGFFGSKIFSNINQHLELPIDWN
jgi:uracil-DNA glycosylase